MLIPLMLSHDQPLQQQLYEQLYALIATARLKPGSRLPSTRVLAEQFSVSRTTVLLAYERLIAEGFIETLPARGTFVAAARPASGESRRAVPGTNSGPSSSPAAKTRIGRPDASLFPAGRWRALIRATLDHLGAQVGTEQPAGESRLHGAVADWLSASRGLAVSPDQIVLMASRQQALHMAAHLVLRPGSRVVVEDPCDADATGTFGSESAELLRIPVDEHGLRVDCLPDGPIDLIHVTPEHQRRLGVALSPDRRTALLAWAERTGATILEDDCEGELRYGGAKVPSLMGQDKTGNVVMLGGFATSLGPWLGLAYLVLPRRLIAGAVTVRRLIDDTRGSLEEAALAEFLGSGGYARHLHQLGKIYLVRRDALLAALQRHFSNTSLVWGAQAGLHLSWFPPDSLGGPACLLPLALRCGLDAAALPPDAPNGLTNRVMLLGFGSVSEQQIDMRMAHFAALADPGHASRILAS